MEGEGRRRAFRKSSVSCRRRADRRIYGVRAGAGAFSAGEFGAAGDGVVGGGSGSARTAAGVGKPSTPRAAGSAASAIAA
jgi:hypothetical protein